MAGRTLRTGAQATASDLLLRLTGRLVKGCRSRGTLPARTPVRRTGPGPFSEAGRILHVVGPGAVLGPRPARRDATGAHAAAGLRVLERVDDVAEHQQPEPERGPVVDERRARSPGQPDQAGPVHDGAGPEQHPGRA